VSKESDFQPRKSLPEASEGTLQAGEPASLASQAPSEAPGRGGSSAESPASMPVSAEASPRNAPDLPVGRDPRVAGADHKTAIDAAQTPLSAIAATTPRTRTGPASWASAVHAAQVGEASAPDDAPRGRTKTGPVEWDRAAKANADTNPSANPNANPNPNANADANTNTNSSANTVTGTGADASARVLERLLPSFAGATPDPSVLLRWVTGIERPVMYLEDGEAMTTARMMELGLTRGGLHERALANLRRAIPPGFAPGDDPALLDDGGAALLALPELVPAGHAWIAYPLRGEGLLVLKEAAPSTAAELERLDRAHHALDAPLFARPVRVTARGFTPLDWPSKGIATGGSR